MHVLARARFAPLIKPARVLRAGRGFAIIAAIVLAFTVPIAVVIVSGSARQKSFTSEVSDRGAGLHLLAYERTFERRLRNLRETTVAEHRLDTADRAAVERSLLRLEDASAAVRISDGVATRLRLLARTWARVSDRRRALHDLDATVAAAIDYRDAVVRRFGLADATDDATSSAIGILTIALPAIDERVDQARNLAAGAIAAKRVPGTTKFAVAILNEQRSHVYQTAIASAERYRLDTGNGHLLDALRRAGFAASRFDAAVAYSLGRKRHGRSDRLRIEGRGDEVSRAIDTAAGIASAAALAGYDAAARLESDGFSRTRNLALLAWLAGAALTIVTSLGIYRRERAAGVERYGRVVERLAMTQSQLASIFENSPFGVAVVDGEGALVRRNAGVAKLVEPQHLAAIVNDPRFAQLLAGALRAFSLELNGERNERDYWVACDVSRIAPSAGEAPLALLFARDVTERRSADAKLRYETKHDPVTRLPNRNAFLERATAAMQAAPLESRAFAFLELQIESGGKTLGYAGDELLAAIASRLASSLEPGDLAARFDGSTFVVLCEAQHDRASARAAGDRLLRRLAPALETGEREVHIRAVVGVAITDRPYGTALDVVRDAEVAMYDARFRGAPLAIFAPEMRDRAERQLTLVSHLRHALERDQFYLAYQPVVSAHTEALAGFEALLRWEHPELGNVPPDEFIALAESTGVIDAIGRWVLDRACAQLATWQAVGVVGNGSCKMAVNVSARELVAADYPAFVERTLARHGVLPADIVLEITESGVLACGGAAAEALARLGSIGVELAIDDFGTGYSSLRYLHQFAFHELKIDGSFVRGADGRLASKPIVTMLVSLAKALGVSTVAEGVETREQAAELAALGVDSLQGYLFGRPVSAALVPEHLRSIVQRAIH